MTRVITRKAVSAFLAGKKFTGKNTETDGKCLYLFGNKIAWHTPDNPPGVRFSLCGYNTDTTIERINYLCEKLFGERPFHNLCGELYFGKHRVNSDEIYLYLSWMQSSDEVLALSIMTRAA